MKQLAVALALIVLAACSNNGTQASRDASASPSSNAGTSNNTLVGTWKIEQKPNSLEQLIAEPRFLDMTFQNDGHVGVDQIGPIGATDISTMDSAMTKKTMTPKKYVYAYTYKDGSVSIKFPDISKDYAVKIDGSSMTLQSSDPGEQPINYSKE